MKRQLTKKFKDFLPYLILIVILSFLIVSDLFFYKARPITFDGHIHMTTMAQFSQALRNGDFPVYWSNNFANYGLPLPLFAHQIPAYLGAFLILLGLSVVSSYNIVMFLGILLGNIGFFAFLNKYVDPKKALVGTVLMSFFPYRIINIYIRGGLPEILASTIVPFILLCVYELNVKSNKKAYLWLSIFIALLLLTHPMMSLVFFLPFVFYYLFTIKREGWKKKIINTITFSIIGIGLSAYYFVPLILESKYLYQGSINSSIVQDSFFSVSNFIEDKWFYFFSHPGPRGNFLKFGLLEFIIIMMIAFGLLFRIIQKKSNIYKVLSNNKLIVCWMIVTLVSVFLVIPISKVFYDIVPGINLIQYPWRFLGVIQYSLPILLVLCLEKIKNPLSKIISFGLIALLIISRTPQLYGKNYVDVPEERYFFTRSNLHSTNLNTIWSDNSENYPPKTKQAEIIEGDGELEIKSALNSVRKYWIDAKTNVRLVDYTFYFPGWIVKKTNQDAQLIPIEFQDPNYRGLITYTLPKGKHELVVKYGLTKVRLVSLLLSFVSIIFIIISFLRAFQKDSCKKRAKYGFLIS